MHLMQFLMSDVMYFMFFGYILMFFFGIIVSPLKWMYPVMASAVLSI